MNDDLKEEIELLREKLNLLREIDKLQNMVRIDKDAYYVPTWPDYSWPDSAPYKAPHWPSTGDPLPPPENIIC